MKLRTLIVSGALAGAALLATSTPTAATNDHPDKCYEQIEQAQYRKFTAPTDAGPWTLYGTWWKGQANKWHNDVGEVAEGPGNHPDGRYTYRKVAERTIDGKRIECPPPPTTTPPETTQPPTTLPPETTVPETTTPPDTTEPPSSTTPETTGPPTTEQPTTTEAPPTTETPSTTVEATTPPVVETGPPPTPPAPPAPATLPETGTETVWIALAAALALGAGGALTRAARRT